MMKTEWIDCPVCGNKTRTMIQEDTEMKNSRRYLDIVSYYFEIKQGYEVFFEEIIR